MLQAKQVAEKIEPILEKNLVTKAELFGSVVRGDMKEDSDIDLLVDMPITSSLLDMIRLKRQLEERVGVRVDLMTYRAVNSRLKSHINKYLYRVV